ECAQSLSVTGDLAHQRHYTGLPVPEKHDQFSGESINSAILDFYSGQYGGKCQVPWAFSLSATQRARRRAAFLRRPIRSAATTPAKTGIARFSPGTPATRSRLIASSSALCTNSRVVLGCCGATAAAAGAVAPSDA